MIKHEQKGAFDVHVAGPLDLETIRFLSGGHPVPLNHQTKRQGSGAQLIKIELQSRCRLYIVLG